MDMCMPVMDGETAIREINRLFPRIRVIALSLYREYEERALAAGAEAFLLKGCSAETLFCHAWRCDVTTHNLVVKSQSTRIWVIGLFMLGGGALFLLGNNWNKLFPTNTSTVYKTGLALVFLVTALALRRHAIEVVLAVGLCAVCRRCGKSGQLALGNWLLPLISAEMTVAQILQSTNLPSVFR